MSLSASDLAIGDLLVERHHLTLAQLDEALEKADSWKVRLTDVLLASQWIAPITLYRTIANHFGVRYVDLTADAADSALLDEADATVYAQRLIIPWRKVDGRTVVVTADPGPDAITFARSRWGKNTDIAVASKFDIVWMLQHIFRQSQSHRAVYALAETDPQMSARWVLTPAQIVAAYISMTVLAIGLAIAPFATLIALNILVSVFYLGNFIFKGWLVWVGGQGYARSSLSLKIEAQQLREDELPFFKIGRAHV